MLLKLVDGFSERIVLITQIVNLVGFRLQFKRSSTIAENFDSESIRIVFVRFGFRKQSVVLYEFLG